MLALVGERAEEGLAAREGGREGRRGAPLRRSRSATCRRGSPTQFERARRRSVDRRRVPGRSSSSSATTSDELATEIDKLATWAAGERVTARETSQRSSPARAETPPFALTDAWGRARRRGGARARASALLERSGDRAARRSLRVAGLARDHVGRVRAVPGARGARASARGTPRPTAEAAPVLRREALRAGAQLHGRRAAATRSSGSRALDHALKGGSRLAPASSSSSGRSSTITPRAETPRRPRASYASPSRRRAARPAPSCARRCSGAARPRDGRACRSSGTSSRCSAAIVSRVALRRRRPRRRRVSVLTVER